MSSRLSLLLQFPLFFCFIFCFNIISFCIRHTTTQYSIIWFLAVVLHAVLVSMVLAGWKEQIMCPWFWQGERSKSCAQFIASLVCIAFVSSGHFHWFIQFSIKLVLFTWQASVWLVRSLDVIRHLMCHLSLCLFGVTWQYLIEEHWQFTNSETILSFGC